MLIEQSLASENLYNLKNIIRILFIGSVFGMMASSCQTTDHRSNGHTRQPLAITTPVPVTTQPGTVQPLPTPAILPIGQACYKAEQLICDIEAAIIRKTNEFRGASHTTLTSSTQMIFAARDWSNSQASRHFIGHGGFPNKRNDAIKTEFTTISVSINAENVAMTSGAGSTAEEIAEEFVDMWRTSPGHRMNMLGNHKAMGAGVARTGNSWYATQIFGSSRE